MCFVISAQRKTYWINRIWQISLANVILQILHPCASSISLCLSVLHCKELAGQASGVKNSFKSSLRSLVPDLPPGQAVLQQHPGVASPLALLRFAVYACVSRPPDDACSHLPRLVTQRLLGSGLRLLWQGDPHIARNGAFIPTQLFCSTKELKCRMCLSLSHHCNLSK